MPVGPKHLIYACRYVGRVHASSKEEYLLAPDHHTGEIAPPAGKPPISTSRVVRLRKRRCFGALGNGAHQGTHGAPQALL